MKIYDTSDIINNFTNLEDNKWVKVNDIIIVLNKLIQYDTEMFNEIINTLTEKSVKKDV